MYVGNLLLNNFPERKLFNDEGFLGQCSARVGTLVTSYYHLYQVKDYYQFSSVAYPLLAGNLFSSKSRHWVVE